MALEPVARSGLTANLLRPEAGDLGSQFIEALS
jgi:hypothetical protein